MCKVLGIAGVSQSNRGDVIKFLKEVTPKLTVMERHGFGYAAIDAEGNVFGEKWLNVDHAWKKRIRRKTKPASEVTNADQNILDHFKDVVTYIPKGEESAPPVYDNFGKYKTSGLKDAVAFIMHSRFSTGAPKTIDNVHPFVDAETALVHNGIVYNEWDFTKHLSDCDSEILLNQYNNHVVNLDPSNIGPSLDDVNAYLACLVLTQSMLSNDGEMIPVMDIFKADALLDVVYVNELETFVWCTDGKIVVDTCKTLGWSTSVPCVVDDEVLIRINAVTGKPILTERFEYSGDTYNTNYSGPWGGYTDGPDEETRLKSKYGADWEKHKDDPKKSAEKSAKVFTETDPKKEPEPKYREITSSGGVREFNDPFIDGRNLTSEQTNEIMVNSAEYDKLDELFEEYSQTVGKGKAMNNA